MQAAPSKAEQSCRFNFHVCLSRIVRRTGPKRTPVTNRAVALRVTDRVELGSAPWAIEAQSQRAMYVIALGGVSVRDSVQGSDPSLA